MENEKLMCRIFEAQFISRSFGTKKWVSFMVPGIPLVLHAGKYLAVILTALLAICCYIFERMLWTTEQRCCSAGCNFAASAGSIILRSA